MHYENKKLSDLAEQVAACSGTCLFLPLEKIIFKKVYLLRKDLQRKLVVA